MIVQRIDNDRHQCTVSCRQKEQQPLTECPASVPYTRKRMRLSLLPQAARPAFCASPLPRPAHVGCRHERPAGTVASTPRAASNDIGSQIRRILRLTPARPSSPTVADGQRHNGQGGTVRLSPLRLAAGVRCGWPCWRAPAADRHHPAGRLVALMPSPSRSLSGPPTSISGLTSPRTSRRSPRRPASR